MFLGHGVAEAPDSVDRDIQINPGGIGYRRRF
jgi:hypothetical protein